MNRIYCIEGCDGSGKSTLARKIADETKGHILHCSYSKDWNIEEYHKEVIEVAIKLSKYQTVIIDRWAVSEFVYGTVFRGGPSYDTSALIEKYNKYITWIYCQNDYAVENHKSNSKKRKEMFDDMTHVVEEYEDYYNFTQNNWLGIEWNVYNFNWVDIDEYVKEIIK